MPALAPARRCTPWAWRWESRRTGIQARAPGFPALFDVASPHPIQQDATLPAAPCVVLEAETGSGKTEAALWRFRHLFAAGAVDGLYFALPTRVAATQMFARVKQFRNALFPLADRPALVLAVPGQVGADDAKGHSLPDFGFEWTDRPDEAARQTRWAAEHPKRFLAAQIAVGTVDQVLLAAIATRHAHLRGTALLRHLLVVDEVHASDRYMETLLGNLLRGHMQAGGHALLLSATLGAGMHARLLGTPCLDPAAAEAVPYPALSWAEGERACVRAVASSGTAKAVRVAASPLIDVPAAIAAIALRAADDGAKVLVIRNTVSAVIATAQALEAAAGTSHPALFRVAGVATLHHGCFAPTDRQLLDLAVEAALGKRSPASAAVVVGTQTLEQSLDLDADLLITDLCPVDVLLQRIGRLHRHHDRVRPTGFASYPAVLLNRDDAGLAKRLPYGGASRIRVSSQCLKRHWRTVEDDWALKEIGAPMALRSREVIEREIMKELQAAPDLAEAIRVALAKLLFGKDNVDVKKRQALLLGRPEIDYLARLAREAAATGSVTQAEATIDSALGKADGKKNLAAMREVAGNLAAGLESAMFGRMVTSDPEANTDAAIHVAHAFTVHAEESESDYFTVVDDLRRLDEGEAGTAGIFETELTSGLFYGYVVVDVPTLVDNLGGDRTLAARVVEHLLHLIPTVSPGAKKGGTAPYAYAELLLVETGRRQPRSLAGAFRTPVPLKTQDVLATAVTALGSHLQNLGRDVWHARRAGSALHDGSRASRCGQAPRPGRHRRLGRRRRAGRRPPDMAEHLRLLLEGPLLAFGGETVDARGVIADFPAASMLTGLLANALGWRRSDRDALANLQTRLRYAARIDRDGARLTDFQTAQLARDDKGWTTRSAPEGRAGGPATYNAPHIRYREYDADKRVVVVLRLDPAEDAPTLAGLAAALDEPARPLFLGRKPCLPAGRLCAGIVDADGWLAALETLPPPTDGRLRVLLPDSEPRQPSDEARPWSDRRDWRSGVHGGTRAVLIRTVRSQHGTTL